MLKVAHPTFKVVAGFQDITAKFYSLSHSPQYFSSKPFRVVLIYIVSTAGWDHAFGNPTNYVYILRNIKKMDA